MCTELVCVVISLVDNSNGNDLSVLNSARSHTPRSVLHTVRSVLCVSKTSIFPSSSHNTSHTFLRTYFLSFFSLSEALPFRFISWFSSFATFISIFHRKRASTPELKKNAECVSRAFGNLIYTRTLHSTNFNGIFSKRE